MASNRQYKMQLLRAAMALLALLFVTPALSQPTDLTENQPFIIIPSPTVYGLSSHSGLGVEARLSPPYELILNQPSHQPLIFDLGEADRQKLIIRLDNHPLAQPVHTLHQQLTGSQSSTSIGLDLGNTALQIGLDQQRLNRFQPFANIECENTFLSETSYYASNCQIVQAEQRNNFQFGAAWKPLSNTQFSANLFRQDQNYSVVDSTAGLDWQQPSVLFNPTPDNLASAFSSAQMPGILPEEMSGVDLGLQIGFTTNQAGDVRLGLQFTHVNEAEFLSFDPRSRYQLNQAEPFNMARLAVDWHLGSFSGGLVSSYRDSIQFFDRPETEPVTTFDLHFNWRTPWNADLSIGASNIFNSNNTDSNLGADENDPFAEIYGRIPYVRYKQDL